MRETIIVKCANLRVAAKKSNKRKYKVFVFLWVVVEPPHLPTSSPRGEEEYDAEKLMNLYWHCLL